MWTGSPEAGAGEGGTPTPKLGSQLGLAVVRRWGEKDGPQVPTLPSGFLPPRPTHTRGDGGVALPGLQVSGGSAKEAVRVAASPRTVGASGAASGRGHPAAGFGPGCAASRTTTLRRDSIRRCSLT